MNPAFRFPRLRHGVLLGLGLALSAAGAARASHPDVKFVLIGPNPSGVARDVSRDGSIIVGWGAPPQPGAYEAILWDHGAPLELGSLAAGRTSFAYGVSDSGNVVVGTGEQTYLHNRAWFWTADSGMVVLPFLNGTTDENSAYAISGNGRYAVGQNWDSPNGLAVRYDIFNGTVTSLGDFPGGAVSSTAYAVNANGSVVVGTSVNSTGYTAFIWDGQTGLHDIRQLLVNGGVDMTGITLNYAYGVSDDGKVVVGSGSAGAWMAILGPRIAITAPADSAFLLAGEGTFATWSAVGVDSVDVLFQSPIGTTTLVSAFPADSVLIFTVPEVRLVHCRLIVRDSADPSLADTTWDFRVKGYELTRYDATGEYAESTYAVIPSRPVSAVEAGAVNMPRAGFGAAARRAKPPGSPPGSTSCA